MNNSSSDSILIDDEDEVEFLHVIVDLHKEPPTINISDGEEEIVELDDQSQNSDTDELDMFGTHSSRHESNSSPGPALASRSPSPSLSSIFTSSPFSQRQQPIHFNHFNHFHQYQPEPHRCSHNLHPTNQTAAPNYSHCQSSQGYQHYSQPQQMNFEKFPPQQNPPIPKEQKLPATEPPSMPPETPPEPPQPQQPSQPPQPPRQPTPTQPQVSTPLSPSPAPPSKPPSPKPSKSETMESLKEQGNIHFRSSRYNEALKLYSQALKEAKELKNIQMMAILHFNKAMAYSKLGSNNIAITECTEAVKLDSNYLKAYLKRAELYDIIGKFEEATVSYEYICEIDKDNREYAMALQRARNKTRGAKKRDYYQILGLPRQFTQGDLKRSYRLRALKHHPDRHSDADIVSRRIEEKLFKEASEAYKILSDPKERFKYDQTLYAESVHTTSATYDLNDLLARTSSNHYKHFKTGCSNADNGPNRDMYRNPKGGKPNAHQRGWG